MAVPARVAGHALLMLLALAVTATTTSAPARRAVDRALESFSIEETATGESAFVRGVVEEEEAPRFSPPSEEVLAQLRPRPSVIAHVVQPGDTVSRLAEKYRITPETIIWANNLQEPDKLPVGHALLILPMSGVLHTVRPGETLESLAERYQIVPQAIAETNGLAFGKQLGASEQLVIPGGRPLDPPRPAVTTRSIDRTEAASRPPSGAPALTEPPPPRVEPAPPPAAPAPADTRPKPLTPTTYEVGDGDSLVSIARRFGVTTATIMLANALSAEDADGLRVGQKLVVPPVSGILHEVVEGDTVRDLASHYGVETQAIIAANALPEPYIVQPGQKLMIPGGQIPDPPPAPAEPVVTYEVTVGDSVVAIAERFGVDPRTIVRYNGLAQAEMIAPGQTLAIPGGRERPVAAGSAVPRSAAASAPATARPAQGPLEAAASLVRPIVRPAAPAAVRPPAPAPAPPPQPVVPAGDNWSVVGLAGKFLGYAYVWGGHSPRVGFDCTGFTWYVFGQAGKRIPNHDLWGQMQSGPRVGRNNLQAGDLVFFANTYMPGLSHVGIYIGGNRFIHAGSERTGVTVTSLSDGYWAPRYYGATRPW
ncbi:MAG TPA: LysM peptidoglycan-binding domain-containing protein [Chloroflexota bacterium]